MSKQANDEIIKYNSQLAQSVRVEELPPYEQLKRIAVADRTRTRHMRFCGRGYKNVPPDTERKWVMSYVRHRKSNYDALLSKIKTIPSNNYDEAVLANDIREKAYAEIRNAIDRKIHAAIEISKTKSLVAA